MRIPIFVEQLLGILRFTLLPLLRLTGCSLLRSLTRRQLGRHPTSTFIVQELPSVSDNICPASNSLLCFATRPREHTRASCTWCEMVVSRLLTLLKHLMRKRRVYATVGGPIFTTCMLGFTMLN